MFKYQKFNNIYVTNILYLIENKIGLVEWLAK